MHLQHPHICQPTCSHPLGLSQAPSAAPPTTTSNCTGWKDPSHDIFFPKLRLGNLTLSKKKGRKKEKEGGEIRKREGRKGEEAGNIWHLMNLKLSRRKSLGKDWDPSQHHHFQEAHWVEILNLSKPQFPSMKCIPAPQVLSRQTSAKAPSAENGLVNLSFPLHAETAGTVQEGSLPFQGLVEQVRNICCNEVEW